MASYFIRNDDYSKSKQYVAFKFLYTDIMYHFPALLRFSSMLWKTNAFLYLVSFRYPNTLDKPN